VYASRLLNIIKQNYNTIEKEALAMVFALHKFKHYLLGNKFVFYVDHVALVYLVNKPHVSRIITRWLLLFLKYDFTIVYKPRKTHVVVNELLILLNIIEPIGVLDQTTNASLFYRKFKWLKDLTFFLRIRHIEGTLSIQQKQRLAKRANPFTLKKMNCTKWPKIIDSDNV